MVFIPPATEASHRPGHGHTGYIVEQQQQQSWHSSADLQTTYASPYYQSSSFQGQAEEGCRWNPYISNVSEEEFYATFGHVVDVDVDVPHYNLDMQPSGSWAYSEHFDSPDKSIHPTGFYYNAQTYSISPEAIACMSSSAVTATSPTSAPPDVEMGSTSRSCDRDAGDIRAQEDTMLGHDHWQHSPVHVHPETLSQQMDEDIGIHSHMIVPSQQGLATYYGEQRSQQTEDAPRSHDSAPLMDYLPLPPGMTPSSYLPLPIKPEPDRVSTADLLSSAQFAQAQEEMRHNHVMVMKMEGRDPTDSYLPDDENTLPAPDTPWARLVPTSKRRHPLLPPGQKYHPLINPEPESVASTSNDAHNHEHAHSPQSRRSSTRSRASSPHRLSPVPRRLDKKPALACLFCRGRKIACGPPLPGSKDKTCNQCARRHLKCEYPKESRRGMRKRKQANLSPPTPPLIKVKVPKSTRKR